MVAFAEGQQRDSKIRVAVSSSGWAIPRDGNGSIWSLLVPPSPAWFDLELTPLVDEVHRILVEVLYPTK